MSPRLTVPEVAAASRRHLDTVYKALESGRLHGSQPVKGGKWTVREECIDAWLDGAPCQHRANVVQLGRRGRVS